jgi:hypothetical protein
MSSRHSSPPKSWTAEKDAADHIPLWRSGPAERAGRPEGWRRCTGGDGGGVTTGHLKVTRRRRWARCGEVLLGGVVGSGDVCSAVAAGGRPRLGG